jgi:hypothetical protein
MILLNHDFRFSVQQSIPQLRKNHIIKHLVTPQFSGTCLQSQNFGEIQGSFRLRHGQFWKQISRVLFGFYSAYILGCLDGDRSSLISKKSLIWFIMISPAKFQPPNPSITATNCIPRFWSFDRFVWKSKKLPNFFIFDKLFSILLWISWIGYLKVLHVEFSSNLSLVWLKIKFF